MSILRMPAVKAEIGHRSHSSIYNAIRAGLFTAGMALCIRFQCAAIRCATWLAMTLRGIA